MPKIRFDWRWIVLIAVVMVLANGPFLPWPLLVAVLAGSGIYVIYFGWNSWTGGRKAGGPRVTYWRGQRIETSAARRVSLPPLRTLGPVVLYLVIGLALILAAAAVLLRQFNL